MSFWMGMANALKDKKEEDFKRELLDREYLEKRRDNVLSEVQRRREQQEELQQDLTDVYWARDYLASAQDSESAQSILDQMMQNPRLATQMREQVNNIQEESGTALTPDSVLGAMTIHGPTGLTPQNVMDYSAAYQEAMKATSQDEFDTIMEQMLSSPTPKTPPTSVSFDPSLSAPGRSGILDEQAKAFDTALISTMVTEQARLAESGDTAAAARIGDMINNISDENIRIRAAQEFGSSAVEQMQTQFGDNPILRGIERNPNIPWSVMQTQEDQSIPSFTTQRQIDEAPSGTRFIWLDGLEYTKD